MHGILKALTVIAAIGSLGLGHVRGVMIAN